MILKRGTEITANKNVLEHLNPFHWRIVEWFRPMGYLFDAFYGNMRGTYRLEDDLELLNLGSANDRRIILERTSLEEGDMHPDMMYSGHDGNMKVHRAILEAARLQHYDGTIIYDGLIESELRDELEGPEEVVIFTQRVLGRISLVRIQQELDVN